MVNIKSYKDGDDRLVLVVENCTGETAVKVNQFIASLLGVTPEPEPIPDVTPVRVAKENNPAPAKETISPTLEEIKEPKPFKEPDKVLDVEGKLTTGDYKGLSLEEAVAQHGIKAAIALVRSEDKTVKTFCKHALRRDLDLRGQTAGLHAGEFADFGNDYMPLIEDGVSQILDMSGYATFEDFTEFAGESEMMDAYMRLLEYAMEYIG